jgi:hypothetical protein
MAKSLLEPDFEKPYTEWKNDPSPDHSATMLDVLNPTIEGAIRTHVGANNPLIHSKARRMALAGLQTYDPTRGRLQSHMYAHLQGLKRVVRKQSQILAVPERISLDKFHLDDATSQLKSELGRIPTDQEIADKTGISFGRMRKVRTFRPPVAEGSMTDQITGADYDGSVSRASPTTNMWHQLVYDGLDPYHKKVMEHSIGINGHKILPNHVLAMKLGKSPGAISQAKARIQSQLNEEQDLSPF